MPSQEPARVVTCNYCGQPAELVTGELLYPDHPVLRSRFFWRCDACDSHVGCHPPRAEGGKGDGKLPLGSLANHELRQARKFAHIAFDSLWKKGSMKRSAAYAWLADELAISRSSCHIGGMDLPECQAVLDAVRRKEKYPMPDEVRDLPHRDRQISTHVPKAIAKAGEATAKRLKAEGFEVETRNDCMHLIVSVGGAVVDFWPSTGLWIGREPHVRQRGLDRLIQHCRELKALDIPVPAPTPMREDARRLFIALWPGQAEVSWLQQINASVSWPRNAWVQGPDKLHMTLHFLGAVPAAHVTALALALQTPFERFDLEFGQFGSLGQGNAVLFPTAASAQLTALRAQLGQVLRAHDVVVDDRPFRPHVTLARHASDHMEWPARRLWRWYVHEFVLVESVLGPDGGYRTLASYPAR